MQAPKSLVFTAFLIRNNHIVFTPKYRRKAIYNQYRESIKEIIITLCKYKGVKIIEGHLMPDHVHLLLSISSYRGYLKGKSALMIFDKHANLKYQYGNRHFWAEGYYVSTVGFDWKLPKPLFFTSLILRLKGRKLPAKEMAKCILKSKQSIACEFTCFAGYWLFWLYGFD